MPFDYKKECKDVYQPSKKPALIEMPSINYVAVRGKGDPNEEDDEYQCALQMLYGISFTIKMSPKSGHSIFGRKAPLALVASLAVGVLVPELACVGSVLLSSRRHWMPSFPPKYLFSK